MAYQVINGKLTKVTAKSKLANNGYPRVRVTQQSEDSARYERPAKPADAGEYEGTCFYSACLRPKSATWYNRGSHKFYCRACAEMLSHANRNDEFCKDADGNWVPLCYAVKSLAEASQLHVSR